MKIPYVPTEWARQSAVWLTWPSQSNWWRNCRADALDAFAKLVEKISIYENVNVNCAPEKIEEVKNFLKEKKCGLARVEFFAHSSDDVWCRDSGAIFRIANGELEAIDFKYNSWGGKFPPWDKDDALASKMAAASGAKRVRIDEMICEGGALEISDDRTLLTTKSVVLNPNRNPSLTQKRAEEIFKIALGVERVIWLEEGLFNDDTDGHIDNIARFAPSNKILAAVCGKQNPSFNNLQRNLEVLKSARNAEGKPYEIVELPLPEEFIFRTESDGEKTQLPAGYANYLIVNDAVLMPSFGQKKSDEQAKEILQSVFADRKIETLDSRVYLQEGGAIHCLTQQQPQV